MTTPVLRLENTLLFSTDISFTVAYGSHKSSFPHGRRFRAASTCTTNFCKASEWRIDICTSPRG
ncbi:unnamed protein product [Haemonchus placei]|uniref:Uncharacterized protein n=1 Tax=Haemonchus placei TaxID=6290 RepID=A0A3P7XB74_HAEPC|nr:unnamed protein product [Haemonchus placei]